MSARALVVSLAAAVAAGALVAACGAVDTTPPVEDVGQAVAAISGVPASVGCVEIDVAGARAVVRRFDVMQNQMVSATLTGLPLGADTFTGLAYPMACNSVASSTQATWISDPVPATLVPQTTASVSLTLHPNGQASVGVGFQGDDAGADAAVTCAAPLLLCAGMCVDPNSDANNCGACGTACATNQTCVSAQCIACAGGQVCTPGGNVCQTGVFDCSTGMQTCVVTGNAPNGTACGLMKVCNNGVCM
jgi:hypothetical protein